VKVIGERSGIGTQYASKSRNSNRVEDERVLVDGGVEVPQDRCSG
jgi:hypothetical protein